MAKAYWKVLGATKQGYLWIAAALKVVMLMLMRGRIKMGLIYKITNVLNGKSYIGKTSRSFEVRKGEHLRSYLNENKTSVLYRAMRKYGIENFQFDIIEDNIPNELLSQKEQDYIKIFNSYYQGYNMTFGGEGESSADREEIINLHISGLNLKEISQITEHTTKTISTILRDEGYQIKQHTGLNSQGLNGTEVQVTFNGLKFKSISNLADYLIVNVEDFSHKRKQL